MVGTQGARCSAHGPSQRPRGGRARERKCGSCPVAPPSDLPQVLCVMGTTCQRGSKWATGPGRRRWWMSLATIGPWTRQQGHGGSAAWPPPLLHLLPAPRLINPWRLLRGLAVHLAPVLAPTLLSLSQAFCLSQEVFPIARRNLTLSKLPDTQFVPVSNQCLSRRRALRRPVLKRHPIPKRTDPRTQDQGRVT